MAATFLWVPAPKAAWYEISPATGFGTPGPGDLAENLYGSYGAGLDVGLLTTLTGASTTLSGDITADEIVASGSVTADGDSLTGTDEFLVADSSSTLILNGGATVNGPSSATTSGPFGNAGFENFGTVEVNGFSSIHSYAVDDFDSMTVTSGVVSATTVEAGDLTAAASLDIESGGSITDTDANVGIASSGVSTSVMINGGDWTNGGFGIYEGDVTFTVQNNGTVTANGSSPAFPGGPVMEIGGHNAATDVVNMTVTGSGSNVNVTGDLGVGWEATANITLTATAVMSTTGSLVTGAYAATGVSNFDISNGGALLQVGGDATLSVLGVTNVTLESGGTMTVGGVLDAAQSGGATANLVVSGGSLQISGDAKLGDGGAGNLTLTAGGTLDISGTLDEGVQNGASGSTVFNDASDSVTIGGDWTIGDAGAHSDTISADVRISLPGTLTLGAQHGGAGSLDLNALSAGLTGDKDVVIGAAGQGSLNVAGGATLEMFSGTLSLGVSSGGSGTLTAGGTGTRISVGKDVVIGSSGAGTLTLNQGATLDASGGALSLGVSSGGAGTLMLGTDVTLSPGGDVTVGNGGSGSIDLGEGATLENASGTVSLGVQGGGGAGTISLSGTNSALNADVLQVGGAGSALISVADGGTVSSSGEITLGASQGGTGSITLAEGGELSAGGDVYVGSAGSGTLTDTGGTLDLFGSIFSVGDQANGNGSVSLQDSTMAVTGSLEIGNGGTGSVGVHDGGTLNTTSIVLGGQTGAKGSFSSDDETASLQVGSMTIGNGGGGSVSMTNGAVLHVTGAVIMGAGALGSSSASANTDSSISIGGRLDVGQNSPASVSVATGGLVGAGGGIVIGDNAGAPGTITVNGTDTAPSRLGFGPLLEIGNFGTGTLNVQAAGTAGVAGAGTVEIATQGGAVGSATITGAGSMLFAQLLTVGGGTLAAGGAGTLSIASSGAVSVASATIWDNGHVALTGGTLTSVPVTLMGTLSGYGAVNGTIDNSGSIAASGGTLVLAGAVSDTGTMSIASSSVLRLKHGAAVGQHIAFGHSTSGTLQLDDLADTQAVISGFTLSDKIVLDGVTADAPLFQGGTLTLESGGSPVGTLAMSGSYTTASFKVTNSAGTTDVTFACYAAGTRVLGAHGEIAVEDLRVGDRLVTMLGRRLAPVAWIGHRQVDLRHHPRPWDVSPVRVSAGAFGAGMPHRDVVLSPDHAAYVGNVLIPIRTLVNGASIAREASETIVYYHIELDRHDVILAEGLPAESYLDTGNRSAFANGGGAVRLHADFAMRVWQTAACAKLVLAGAELEAARRLLLRRAEALGHVPTHDAALHVRADGRVVTGRVEGTRHRFHLPADCGDVRLVSRHGVPAETGAASRDTRRLGVAMAGLRLDGVRIDLGDARLASGWHAEEGAWRWTDGDASLAIAGGGMLDVDIAMTERYWLERDRLKWNHPKA
jgi:collagen type I/II/III/V/XI/XXIV/XXVII alpha